MEYKESDVENLIAVGYLTGVVDAFSKSMNISAEDMKTNMMKSDTIRHTLVDSLGSTDTIGLVKKSKEIASRVLSGDNTAQAAEPPTESLLQRAEHAIGSLFGITSTPQVPHPVEPVVQPEVQPVVEPVVQPVVEPVVQPVVEPVVQPVVEPVVQPVVEPVVQPVVEPVVQPVVEPVVQQEVQPVVQQEVQPVVPNASAMNPMAPPPVSVGGRKKNKSRKRKSKKGKKTRK